MKVGLIIFLSLMAALSETSAHQPPLRECRRSVIQFYSDRTFRSFYDGTMNGEAAPVVRLTRLGDFVGASARMTIYRRPAQLRTEETYYFVHTKSRKLIGVVSIQRHSGSHFINIYFNRYYQEKGYATEAYANVLPLIMEHLDVAQLFAVISEDNIRSIRLHSRSGFEFNPISKIWILDRKD